MGLTVIVGPRGSGKTVLLAAIAKQAHAKGMTVVSNMDLPFPHKRVTTKAMDANPGDVIAIDADRATRPDRPVNKALVARLRELQESGDVFIATQSSGYLPPDLQEKIGRAMETRLDEQGLWVTVDDKRYVVRGDAEALWGMVDDPR